MHYRWFVVEPVSWGLTSIARDYVSSLLRAMARNLTVVYKEGFRFCPPEMEGRYLDCYWQDLGSCQSTWRAVVARRRRQPVIEEAWPEAVKRIESEQFPHWLWEKLRRSGAVHVRDGVTGEALEEEDLLLLDAQLYLQVKLSVLRAMAARVVLRPRASVMAEAGRLVEQWRALGASTDPPRGLVIHLRRTDKKRDDGPHWRYIDFDSTAHIGTLVRRMESSLSRPFGHFLVLSDDTKLQHRAALDLPAYFRSPSPVSLRSDLLCHFLGADHEAFENGGHEAMDDATRTKLYVSGAEGTGLLRACAVQALRSSVSPRCVAIRGSCWRSCTRPWRCRTTSLGPGPAVSASSSRRTSERGTAWVRP